MGTKTRLEKDFDAAMGRINSRGDLVCTVERGLAARHETGFVTGTAGDDVPMILFRRDADGGNLMCILQEKGEGGATVTACENVLKPGDEGYEWGSFQLGVQAAIEVVVERTLRVRAE